MAVVNAVNEISATNLWRKLLVVHHSALLTVVVNAVSIKTATKLREKALNFVLLMAVENAANGKAAASQLGMVVHLSVSPMVAANAVIMMAVRRLLRMVVSNYVFAMEVAVVVYMMDATRLHRVKYVRDFNFALPTAVVDDAKLMDVTRLYQVPFLFAQLMEGSNANEMTATRLPSREGYALNMGVDNDANGMTVARLPSREGYALNMEVVIAAKAMNVARVPWELLYFALLTAAVVAANMMAVTKLLKEICFAQHMEVDGAANTREAARRVHEQAFNFV
jgi:hypothetical protein